MFKMEDFFQFLPMPDNQYMGTYDLKLVALSFMVAVFASYIALDMTGRLRDISNTRENRALWLAGGAIAMGAGIWSMHFIGMLSFTIPGLTLRYDSFWTILSLLVAMVASGFALFLLQIPQISLSRYIIGGIILGLAIASMHYTGMAGMLITLDIRYLPGLFWLSIFVAIVASEAAIWLALKSNQVIFRIRNRIKFGSAIIMGIAICGMHYTGMAASIFTPYCTPIVANSVTSLDPTLLAIIIAGVTFGILGIAFFASSYNEAINQQKFEMARQLGMAEISANVLHSVGNVLNSVNVSANLVHEKNAASKLEGLHRLNDLLEKNSDNLSEFFKTEKGRQIAEYIKKLSHYWQEQQTAINNETVALKKNIEFIKEIISTQQEMSKTADNIEQMISVHELLDEALLISGVSINKEIHVDKNYGKFKSIIGDKTRLLQIFVNLIRNAKDALHYSSKNNKTITLTTTLKNNTLIVKIADNGIGIQPKVIKKIFQHGFTTKKDGHGFGLHATALEVNRMGGRIQALSDGYEKGSTFVIELPYKLP